MKGIHLWLTALSLILSGCVYVHSDAKQKLAEEARAEFGAATSQATGVTGGLDLKGRHQLIQSLTREFHRSDETIPLGALLDKTWKDLTDECSELLRSSRVELENSARARKDLEARIREQMKALPGVRTNVSSLEEALNQASKSAARYSATQTLLKESLRTLVDDTRTNGWNDLTNLLGQSRSFTSYDRAADESLKESQTTDKVSELLEIDPSLVNLKRPQTLKDMEGLRAMLEKVPNNLASGLTLKHPGISTTLIGLAYDLAQTEEKRLREGIAFAKSSLSLQKQVKELRQNLANALELELDPMGDGISAMASNVASKPTETTRTTLDGMVLKHRRATTASLKAANDAESDLQRQSAQEQREYLGLAYRALARTFSLRTEANEIEAVANRMEMLESEHSLQLATIDIQEREAVIRRGLEGLVAFHNGGLNQEDLSRIIGLAQTAGIFWIGTK